MNENMKYFDEKLNNLDCSQTLIERLSEEFYRILNSEDISVHDLFRLWKFYIIKKTNKLPYIYLINDIILNSASRKINFQEILLSYLFDVLPLIYFNLPDKIKKEFNKIFEIWNDRKILESEKYFSLKSLLNSKISIFDHLNNPLFSNILESRKIKISTKLLEYASNLKNIINYSNRKNNNNKIRGKVLKISSDLVKMQNQIFFKHVFYIQEIDKMLLKLDN